MGNFLENVKAKAKKQARRIVLPEASDERVIKAAAVILAEKIAQPILIGEPAKIAESAAACGVSVEGATIIDKNNIPGLDAYVDKLVELRAKKGMTPEKARQILTTDNNFLGAMLLKMGEADGMVSGSASPTANVLRAALQVVGTAPGIKTVSSVFVMELERFNDVYGDILLFGDCSVIPVPTAEQLADIAVSSAYTAKTVTEMEPKISLMSFSTKGSANHETVDKVKAAGQILRDKNVDFSFDDELQADASIVKSVAAAKAPGSEVAGNANVLIFPSLEAGNIGYKLVQRLAGANAYGPIVQGLAAPINDLSRGCSADDIVGLVAITATQAN